MKSGKPHVKIRKLTAAERLELKRRESKYRDNLVRQGYTTHVLTDETGCFGVVLVSDPNSGRKGFLLPDGNIRWIDEAMSLGALADATVSGVSIDELSE